MENLIDLRYFRGVTELPYSQIQTDLETPSGQSADIMQATYQMDIAEYQLELLTRLFGSEIIPTEESVSDAITLILYNENILRSAIADFVFCNAITDFQSSATIGGEKIHTAQDSISVSYQEKYLFVWNRLVKSCLQIRKLLYDNGLHSTYPTDINDSLYKFQSFV